MDVFKEWKKPKKDFEKLHRSLMLFEDCSTLYRHQQCTGVRKLRQLFSDALIITNDIKHKGWSAVLQDCFSTICIHFIKIIIVSTRRKKMIKETEETIGDNLRLVYEVLGCKGDAVVYAALTAAAVTTDSSGLSYVSQAHAFGALVKEVLRSYIDVTNPVVIMWCVMLGKLWLNITKPEFVPDVKETVLQLLPSTVFYQSYEDANISFKSTKKLLRKSVHSLAKMVPAVREDPVVDKNALLVELEDEEEIIQHFTALHQVLLPCAQVLKSILVQAPGAQGSEWAEGRANVKQLPRNEQSGNEKVAESKTNTRKRSGVNKKKEKSESKTAAEKKSKKIPNKKQLSKNKSGDSKMVAEEQSKKKNKLGGRKMIEKIKKATEKGYTNRDDDGESKMSESNPQHDIHINPEHLDMHQQCTVSPQELPSATCVDKRNNRAIINGVDTSENFVNVNEDSVLPDIKDLSEDKNKILENGVGISKVVDDSKLDPFHRCASSRGVLPDVTGVCDDTCSHSDNKVNEGQSTNNGDEERNEQSQTCSQMNDKSSGSHILRGEALTFEIQSSLVGNSPDLCIPNLLKSDPHLPPSVSTDEEEYPQVSPALKSDGITDLALTMDSPDRVIKPIFTSTFYGFKKQKTQYFQPCGTPKTILKDRSPGIGSFILTPPNPTTTKSSTLPSPKRGLQDKNESLCNDILIVHTPEKVKLASNMEYELELCSVLLEEDSVNRMERSTKRCYDTTMNSGEKKKKRKNRPKSKADNVSQKKNTQYQVQTRATSKNVCEENAIKETILTSACSKSSECNMDGNVCGSAKVKKATNKCNKKSSAVQPNNKNSSSDVRMESSMVNDLLVADKGTRNTDSGDHGSVSYLVNELTMTEEHNSSSRPDLAYGIVNKEGLDADRDTEQILMLKAQNITLRKKKNKQEQKKSKRGREELYSMSTNSRKVHKSEDMKRKTGKLKKRSKRIKRTTRCLNSTSGSNGASEWEVSDINTSIDSNIRAPKSYFPALNMDENGNSYVITTEIVSNGWNSHVLCKDLDRTIPFMESEVPIACNLGIDETNGTQDILDASVKTSHGNEDQPEVLLRNQITNKQAVHVDGIEVMMKNLDRSTDSIYFHNKSNNIPVHQLSVNECNNHKADESTLGEKSDSGKDDHSNIGTTNMPKENTNPESKIASSVRTRNILKASILNPESNPTTAIRTVNISEVNLKDSENNATPAVKSMNVSDLSKQNYVSNPSTKDDQHKYTPAEKAHQRNTTLSQDECYLLELYRTRPSETKDEGKGEVMDVSVEEDSQQSTLLTAGALALLEKQELINKANLDGGQGSGSKFNHEQLNRNPPRTRKSTEKKKLQQKKVRIIRRSVREPHRPSVSRTYNPLTFTRKELDPRCNATHHGCPGMAKEEEPLIKYGRKKKKVDKAKEMVLSKKKIANLVQKLLETDGTLEKNRVQSDNNRANYSPNKKVFGTNKNRKECERLMVKLQKKVTSINKERSDVCEQTEFPITTGKIADLSETNFIIRQDITTTHTTNREGRCLEENDQEKQNTNNTGTSKTNKTIDNKVEGLNNCNEIAAVNHNRVVSLSHNGKMNYLSHQNRVGYICPGPSHYGNLTKEKGLSFAKLDSNNADSPTSYPSTINPHLPLRDEENGPSSAAMGGKALDVSSGSPGLCTKVHGPRPFFTASTPKISRWPGFRNDAKSLYSTKFQNSQIEENNYSDIIFKEENLLPEADYVTLEKSITPSSLQWLKEECPDYEKKSGDSGSSKIFFSALEEFDDVSSDVLHTETIENWKLNTERIDISREEEEHCHNTLKDMRDYYTPPCQTPDNIAMLPLTKTCNKKTEEEMTPNYDHSLVEAVSNPWEENPISQSPFPDLPGGLHGPLGLDKSSLCAPSHSHSTAKTNGNIQESPMQAQVLPVQMDWENNELFARLPILHVPHTVCKEMDVHFYRTSPNHSDTALLFDNHTYKLSVPKQQSHNGSLPSVKNDASSANDFKGRNKHSTCRRKLLDSFIHGKQEGKSKPKSMERHLSPKIITNSTSLQEGRLLTSELTSSLSIHVCKCGFVHSCRGEQQRGIVNNNIKSSSIRKRNNSAEGVKDKNLSNYKNKYLPQLMNPWSPCLGTHICNLQTAQFQQATRPTAGIPEATAALCPHHREPRGRLKHLMNPKLMLVSCKVCRLSLLERRQCTFHQEPCLLVEGEVVHGYTQQIDLLWYREYVRVISEAFPKYKDIILPEPSKMAPLCSFHMVSEVSDAEAFCLVVPTPPNSSGTVGTAENLNTSLDSLFALLGPEELSCIDSPTEKHAPRPSTKRN
ncbi:hypothetical protein Pcinc_016406 [Petrolisthes cinctipes]|uniref:Uncharacterized protein n=1 Tax=Petrolisthes cinctipes TaxID=88211 RepID=A0AAE1FR48_PETCI|nr:hypothetical protein Pcinc_016406 [Petrolisthes cinctipes]